MNNLKINLPFAILGVILALLLGYGVYALAEGDPNDYVAGIVSSLCFAVMLILMVGVNHTNPRIMANLRTLSMAFLVVMFISHFSFAAICVSMPSYFIINGCILVVYMLIYFKLASIKGV